MCLFFFLSSYLITELLLRKRAKAGTIHMRAFFVGRILRIWPLYLASIEFTICLGHVDAWFHVGLPRVITLISLAGNWYMAKHGPDASPAAPFWSISLQEQFYLVWPFLAKVGGTRALGTTSVLLLPLAWLILAMHGCVNDDTNKQLTRLSFLLAGITAWSVELAVQRRSMCRISRALSSSQVAF